jgi:hypothetical protein
MRDRPEDLPPGPLTGPTTGAAIPMIAPDREAADRRQSALLSPWMFPSLSQACVVALPIDGF